MLVTHSLLISTYNWHDALELCLLSVLQQTVLPQQIVIADDGSTKETEKIINSIKQKTSIPILHVWHEDAGFRKTIILNEAIKNCTGEYIIQIDGDIIVDQFFIEDHLRFAEKGFFIRGSRTLLSEKITQAMIANKTMANLFGNGNKNVISSFRSRIIAILFSKFTNKYSIEGVKGCNMAFWKQDCIKVNGYNNDITGWGREDSEFAARLINAGVFKKHVKFNAICYHLHHSFFSRDNDERNMKMLQQTISKKINYCTNGYSQKNNSVIIK